jgi:hypothetical protein
VVNRNSTASSKAGHKRSSSARALDQVNLPSVVSRDRSSLTMSQH